MTDQAAIRAAIVDEAISWERTPYHFYARLKGVGVDCAQLPIAVYSAVGCMPQYEPGHYSQQWMLHRDEEIYLEEIRRFSRDIPIEEAQPGDLIVWKLGRTYSHSGILIPPPAEAAPDARHVIHAALRGGAVIRADINGDEELRIRERLAFSVFNADGSLVYQRPPGD